MGRNDGATPDVATCASPHTHNTCDGFANLQVKTARCRKRKNDELLLLKLGTWNVNSLVENDGGIETARQARSLPVAEDKKIELVVRQFQKFEISIAGLQETKWFGQNEYCVSGVTVLAAGRPVPTDPGQPAYRGEGVAIVLSGVAQLAWKTGGSQWRPISSRVVVAKLLFGDQWLHVISCYAPTFAKSRQEKDKFFDELRECLLSIPDRDLYVILGDFNARVGSSTGDKEDDWRHVRGRFGVGELNEAGAELLSFLSMFGARICNTCFKKKDIHKFTWQHPRSQRWHCIDYAIIRQRDARRCIDSRVFRSAECGTDHKLVCMTLSLGNRRQFYPPPRKAPSRCRFNVAQLVRVDPSAPEDDEIVRQTVTAEWKQVSADCLEATPAGDTAKEQWTSLRDATVQAAEAVLGKQRRRQPNWFLASSATLEPVLTRRNALFRESLMNPSPQARRDFVRARSEARDAVREAKDNWFRETATTAETKKFGHKDVWNSIRDLQSARRGLIPVKSGSIKKADGSPCASTEEQQNRWREHFLKVLNIPSAFDRAELDLVCQREVRVDLARPPSPDELHRAMRHLSNGKAAGTSGILPEMVKVNSEQFYQRLLVLIDQVWRDGVVPQDWVDAEIVPIPKKGDLSSCDNWRGIALLDVVGKFFGRVVQNRLQDLAEVVLPETQCGFRSGRSCTDMTFVVRQVVEKCHEHHSKGFLVFVDLKKAYDSVPRAALWIVLLRLGVPELLVRLLQSFHDNMSASIIVNGAPADGIAVSNGLRQGCTMAPVLFNLFAGAVMERWRARLQSRGIDGLPLRSCIDGQLFKRSKRGNDLCIADGEFADDAVLFAFSHGAAQLMLQEFVEVGAAFGLSVNMMKTVFMAVGHQVVDRDRAPLSIRGEFVQHVSEFKYLGSNITPDGRCHADVASRLAAASKAFGSLYSPVFRNATLSSKTKQQVYTCCILSVLLYGSECWVLLQADIRRLERFHNRCVRVVLGVSRTQQWEDHLSTVSLHRMCATEPIEDMVARRRLQWLGHLARMGDSRLPKAVLYSWMPSPRPAHGPRRRWRDVVRDDLKSFNLYAGWSHLAARRHDWIQAISDAIVARRAKLSGAAARPVHCSVCCRYFTRSGMLRHKCTAERHKPLSQQTGAVYCPACDRWLASRGGLAVHRCEARTSSAEPLPLSPSVLSTSRLMTECSSCNFHCPICNRCMKSLAGFRRHNCNRGNKRSDASLRTIPCPTCPRKFRSSQYLAQHKCKS